MQLTEAETKTLERTIAQAMNAPTAKEGVEIMGKWYSIDHNQLPDPLRHQYHKLMRRISQRIVFGSKLPDEA